MLVLSLAVAALADVSAVWFDLPKARWFHSGPIPDGSWWLQFQGLRGWKTFETGGWSWHLGPPPAFGRWLPMLLLATAGVVGLAWIERRRAGGGGRRIALPLGFLVAIGYGLQLAALYLKDPHPNQLLFDRITSYGFTGYFSTALTIHDPATLFSGYLAALRADSKLCSHCVTHPPGPILFFWLPLRALERLPSDWRGALARHVAKLLGVDMRGQEPAAGIVAMLAPHVILLGAALIVVPLYGLARLVAGRRDALPAAALGVALPGLTVMSPELDQLYATLTASVLLLLLLGAARPRQAVGWGLLAGLLWSLGLYATLALWVLVVPIAFVMTTAWLGVPVIEASDRPSLSTGGLARWGGSIAVGAVLPWLALRFVAHFDGLAVIAACKQHHMTDWIARRPYGPWVWYNLVDVVQFLGLPLAAFSLLTLVDWRSPRASEPHIDGTGLGRWPRWLSDRVNLYALLFWGLVGAIDLTGLTRGEVGRLWIFLDPLALLGISHGLRRRFPGPSGLHALLLAQLAVLLPIAGRWFTP